ncbi:microsomal triacylglycerol transfer protein [Musca vetustissima]|uniref:microsomal triacylglycerol transfer protein n=1 Tax=Musca vetustissima TaxID=27455 RepID=UPI002AB60BF0|nr:microsomal triacylglycerol transfer protein [Musca vetustissima]
MILRFLLCNALLALCAATGTEPLFAPLVPFESSHYFTLTNKVTVKEMSHGASEETSYNFRTLLRVNSVWSKDKDQLLQLYFTENQVSTIDKKGKEKIQPIYRIPDRPFYIGFEGHGPTKVLAHSYKDQSLLNMEKGIASLLQLQYKVGPMVEIDSSGMCNVFYNAKSTMKVEKKKIDCSNWDLKMAYRSERALDISRLSSEKVDFDISPEGALLQAHSVETHKLYLTAQPEIGTLIESVTTFKHIEEIAEPVEQLKFESLTEAVESLLEWYREFEIESDVDGAISEFGPVTLKNEVKKYAKKLTGKLIGHEELAEAFARMVPVARITSHDEFVEILENHKDLHSQLVDLLGAAQTFEAHKAINSTYKYNRLADFNMLEKYLQSLAVGTHPDIEIVKDLFAIAKTMDDSPLFKKIKSSVIQCMSSLAHHFEREVIEIDIRDYLTKNLKKDCGKDIDCKLLMIRGLQNVLDQKSIEPLMGYAFLAEEDKLVVAAMQALRRYSVTHFNELHRVGFTLIFFQNRKKYPTSARTLALDILLDMRPTKEQLGQILDYLASNDHHFEIKTYVIQKLRMYAELHPKFKALLQMCLNERPHINNYHILGQKGFTSVLARPLSSSPAFNETLLSVQEVHKGVLRRGSVELLLTAGEYAATTFKLGIFTNGLESFVGGNNEVDGDMDDDDEDENKEYDPISAGMEISVNGILHRPLIFFTGKAELMGHIWSGTVSESTPAFQGTMLGHDHEHYLLLTSGATIHFTVIGARSVDLNGKAGFSLWNRNANTEIKQETANVVFGKTKVGFTYATATHEFVFSYEPKIVLEAHIDFYDELKLCMRLQRPEMVINVKNTKSVALHSMYDYTKTVNKKYSQKIPGHTIALNQKNNNMCRMVAKDLQH